MELIISQGSEGSDVKLEFHEWQGEYVYDSVPPLDKGSAHPDHIYGINFMNTYLCAE